ncbi:MAG TPA: M13 family metallopeptidase [Dokdonella sp.]
MPAIPTSPLVLALAFATASAGAADAIRFDPADVDPDTAAPCTDLNAYANAKWLAANPVPADRTTWGTFERLDEASLATQRAIVEQAARAAAGAPEESIEHKVGVFYASAMDEAAIGRAGDGPIRATLARIGKLDTPAAIAGFVSAGFADGAGIPFRFYSRPDYRNSAMNIAYVAQGGLGLPERGYYLDDTPDFEAKRKAYVAHVQRTLQLVGIPQAEAAEQARRVMAFETRLAKASFSRVELRNPANQYHYATLADAAQATPRFDWPAFFAAQGVGGIEGFSLSQPKFFAEFDAMLAEVAAADWQAYLRYHTIDDAAPFLSAPFVEEHFAYHGRTLRGQKELEPRWKRALEATNDQLGMALGELYVAKVFPPEAKARALELVGNVSAALRTRIEQLDWMGDDTRRKALAKWAAFKPKIGYPDTWRSWDGLVLKAGDFHGNVVAARRFNRAYMASRIGKPVDRSEWFMTPQTVNAYYSPTMNEIVFPAAILQPPFFDAKADDALNYGGIGAVIGHEMSHGYDDQGSQFDAAGNYANWWTEADRKAFEARTDRLVAQFDDYVAIDGLHVKGKLTLGENIADLGGLATAHDALRIALAKDPAKAAAKIDGYDQDQRFFLNWATVWRRNFLPDELRLRLNTDPHAPAGFRAIGAPSNMPAFAEAFNCKAGDAMVRGEKERVRIW